MDQARAYTLHVQRSMKMLMVGMVILFTIVGVLMLSGILKDDRGNGPPWFVGLIFLLAIGINAYYWFLRIPYQIAVMSDGYVEFISIVRRRRIAVREIRSIMPHPSQLGFLIVRTGSSTISILNQFDGFHEFLAWLKANNPSVELRGC